MARRPRSYCDGSYHHVMHRGNNKRKVFLDNSDYTRFYLLLSKYLSKYKINIFHYCLMPNHLHLLIQIATGNDLSKFMQGVSLSYTKYYQRRYEYVGSLWQGRYKNIPVESESYLIECGRYIERNPIRAKLVKDIDDYPYSSYRYYAHGKSNMIITEDVYFKEIAATERVRQRKYRKYLEDERPYDSVLDATLKDNSVRINAWNHGSDGFHDCLVRGSEFEKCPLGT